ncbi:hypothetical protein [Leptospira sp. 'Mane']|uniref:hypothetical protein n=1 Tax=Leptospira sp. 'Mane' TaxID=3387407 RepID=UPI00398BBB21
MMTDTNDFSYANLGFFLNYSNGYKQNEIETELYRIIFQTKEMTHYDREKGGSFGDLEQEKNNPAAMLLFISNIISSVYWLNESKGFDPYIVVDFSDIETKTEDSQFIMIVKYRLLQDLQIAGEIRAQL